MSLTKAVALRFQRAYAAHQAGDLAAARTGYQAVLEAHPQHFDALHMLGVAALQGRDYGEAARRIEQALRLDPGYALAWLNLAGAYRGLARPADAADCLTRKMALAGEDPATLEAQADLNLAAGRVQAAHDVYLRLSRLAPPDSDVLVGLGIAQRSLGQPTAALQTFERALQHKPAHVRADNNIGITLCELGRHAEALAHFDRLLAREPAHAAAHNARALALWKLDRLDEAEQAYDRAIAIAPDHGEAYGNRGALLATRGRHDLAMRDYARAIELQPRRAEAHNGLGALLASQHRIDEAITSYRQAIACQPTLAQAHNNLALALVEAGQLRDALATFDRAIDLLQTSGGEPLADALANRSGLQARMRRHAAAAADARAALDVSARHPYTLGNALYFELMQCDWRQRADTVAAIEAGLLAGEPAATPFVTLTVCNNPALQLASARLYANRLYPARDEVVPRPPPHPRIRLAFISADFHEHATAYLIAGVLEHIDKTRFELFGLSFGPTTDDRYQRRLTKAFDQFITLHGHSDAQAAQLIRSLGVDIAVDLKGYTNGARPGIFSHRAAPLQASYLGYPGTSGMAHIDYLIADPVTVPVAHEPYYSERIARLPHCYQCNDARRPISERRFSRADCGLPEQGFVFCSFNNSYKITPEVFDVWMRLLQQVDGSVLWLLQECQEVPVNLRREAAARGVAPERLVFATRLPPDEHLARQRCADLFLDTWPVNAHTTASDALWAGLPLITLVGSSFASRVADSLLQAIDQPGCVAPDAAGYEALALALARDPHRLAALRYEVQLAHDSAVLFDTARFTRHFELLFEQMHARHQAGLPPESFTLPAAD